MRPLLRHFTNQGLLGGVRRRITLRAAAAAERAAGGTPSISTGDHARRISVVVPVHDAPEVVERCLQSLVRHRQGAEVIIVDDGSKLAQTRDLLVDFANRFDFELIRHEQAQSHSRACAAGAARATREILCLLNSDTVLTQHAWKPILAEFDRDSRVAVVGPVTSQAAGIQVIKEIQPFRHQWDDAQIETFAKRYTAIFRPPSPAWLLGLSRHRTQNVSGFAFFIRRDLWERSGGFDERLPDYGNELELCARLRAEGWRLVVTRRSYIHHLGKASFGNASLDDALRRRSQFNELAQQILAERSGASALHVRQD